jgi:hypothetical protein
MMATEDAEGRFGYTCTERRALFDDFRKLYDAVNVRLASEGSVTSLDGLDARSREYHRLIGDVHRELRQRWEITPEQLEAIIREGIREDW